MTYFKEDTCMTNIEKVNHFLDEANTFYFLTTDGDKPKGFWMRYVQECFFAVDGESECRGIGGPWK